MAALPTGDTDPPFVPAAQREAALFGGALPDGDRISFPRLQKLLGMSVGNLSVHLRKLEDTGYTIVVKTHEGRTPATYISLSWTGRRAMEDYTAALRQLLPLPTPENEGGGL